MKIEPKLQDELRAAAADRGLALLEVEAHGNALRLILDREDGAVTIDDCADMSRAASVLLDVYDHGSSRYVLEVSSPGLDRKLYGPGDYDRFSGSLAKITYHDPEQGANRTVVARLLGFASDDGGRVRLQEESRPTPLEVPYAAIRRARLEIEL